MKNACKIIPCYSADTAGVCSGLYELGGMTVVHDASGCNSTYSTHDEPRWTVRRSNIFISALTEIDAIMGNDEKLISDTVRAAEDKRPAFIAICGSPMPMMTGVDFDAVAMEIESRTGIETIPLHTNGTRSYIEGAGEAFREVVRRFVKPPVQKRLRGVNVVGATPLDLPLGMEKEIREWLFEKGFEQICCIGMGSTLMEIEGAANAGVSLVVSACGLEAARELEREYGIPYVCGVPVGSFGEELAKALEQAAETGISSKTPFTRRETGTVVIGEPVMSLSIASATGGRVIAAVGDCGDMLESFDRDLWAEEDIEECLAQLRPERVIADTLYKYILPPGTELVEVPHFAFSGRCYQRRMKSLRQLGEL